MKKEIVDSMALLHTKLEPFPQVVAEFRSWKNSFLLMNDYLDISSNENLSKWTNLAFQIEKEQECQGCLDLIPRFHLDRWLAS